MICPTQPPPSRSLEELPPYDGRWVAYNPGGFDVFASAYDLLEWDRKIIEAGIDPETFGYERNKFTDAPETELIA